MINVFIDAAEIITHSWIIAVVCTIIATQFFLSNSNELDLLVVCRIDVIQETDISLGQQLNN